MQKGRSSPRRAVEKQGQLDLRELLRERKLLIADIDPVHQAFLLKIATEMGFETRKIYLARDSSEVVETVRTEGVTTILFDDSMGYQTLDGIREALKDEAPESVFIFLLCQNSSQAGVGRAVESDVDGLSLKPFPSDSFKREFMQAFSEKIQPNEFNKVLSLGKCRLFEGDLEQAEKLFTKAKEIGPSASLAHFYSGQVLLMKQLLQESCEEFKQGVLLNQIHCKCLKAMFDLLYSQNRLEESYEVLRRLVGVFPDHVDRLKLVIRLAIKTGNFFDIQTWFEVYQGQEVKSEDLTKHIGAGLSVLGRYYLMTQKVEEALQTFKRTLGLDESRKALFLTYAVESLQKYGYSNEASALLKAYDPKLASSPEAA